MELTQGLPSLQVTCRWVLDDFPDEPFAIPCGLACLLLWCVESRGRTCGGILLGGSGCRCQGRAAITVLRVGCTGDGGVV